MMQVYASKMMQVEKPYASKMMQVKKVKNDFILLCLQDIYRKIQKTALYASKMMQF